MPIQPGTRLGAYEVQELIGQGAMGSVYLARHQALDRMAAVKVMRKLEDDPIAAERFSREGRAIALLRHTNIVTVYDFGEYEGTPYMIVEHVPGGNLASRLQAGRLSNEAAIRLLRQIASGLDYAHEMGVVHRDVKPANVLMGRGDTPVIADFGLAKLQQQATMTAYGVATGTPAYMAPEQIAEGEIGPATDVYALATVAYEMLTGRLPYENDSVMQLLMSKMRDDPVPPTRRNPELPARADRILLRGLARQPDARWKSCGAMVEALAGVLLPATELTQPVPRWRPAQWFARFDWVRWSWAALPVAALAVVLILFVLVPRLRNQVPPAANNSNGGPTVVACPAPSASPPQLAVDPTTAAQGDSVTITGSGFETGQPLFIVLDSAGDCTNPTAGAPVYSTTSYANPLTVKPSPIPDTVSPGDYQVRACNQKPGQDPYNCVQVPFSVTAGPSPSPSPAPSGSPSASPS